MAKPLASPENKGEECSLIEERGKLEGCYKKSTGVNGVQSIETFLWQIGGGLLLEEEESHPQMYLEGWVEWEDCKC